MVGLKDNWKIAARCISIVLRQKELDEREYQKEERRRAQERLRARPLRHEKVTPSLSFETYQVPLILSNVLSGQFQAGVERCYSVSTRKIVECLLVAGLSGPRGGSRGGILDKKRDIHLSTRGQKGSPLSHYKDTGEAAVSSHLPVTSTFGVPFRDTEAGWDYRVPKSQGVAPSCLGYTGVIEYVASDVRRIRQTGEKDCLTPASGALRGRTELP
ncbi:hypothetical protein JTB14_038425 [Gonioctena quinquepunctata]|nr:hypothetical protein JTB14_038425 [Gonioctena quinquepunctata]